MDCGATVSSEEEGPAADVGPQPSTEAVVYSVVEPMVEQSGTPYFCCADSWYLERLFLGESHGCGSEIPH